MKIEAYVAYYHILEKGTIEALADFGIPKQDRPTFLVDTHIDVLQSAAGLWL